MSTREFMAFCHDQMCHLAGMGDDVPPDVHVDVTSHPRAWTYAIMWCQDAARPIALTHPEMRQLHDDALRELYQTRHRRFCDMDPDDWNRWHKRHPEQDPLSRFWREWHIFRHIRAVR